MTTLDEQPADNAAHLAAVSSRMAPAILDFCAARVGQRFYADDLRAYVQARMPGAPGSADRILRDLRQRGHVDYVVENRARSLYRVHQVRLPKMRAQE